MGAYLERLLKQLWFATSPGVAARLLGLLLRPLSVVTYGISRRNRARIARCKTKLQAVPVVIVGNLIAGGAGKTPLTIALCQGLRELGWRPGIICRGDGASKPVEQALLVQLDTDAQSAGDEAVLLATATDMPVAVCRRRALALELLLRDYPDVNVIVSDDGLQHDALPRTVELAVFDTRGIGNGRLLPSGPLREPLAHLAQMDAVIINNGLSPTLEASSVPGVNHTTRFTSVTTVRDLLPLNHYRGARSDATYALPAPWAAALPQGPICALAGIADPHKFFRLLSAQGLRFRALALSDHAAVDDLLLAGVPEPVIIMTEKDAVKCQGLNDLRVFVLRITAQPEPDLLPWLKHRLQSQHANKTTPDNHRNSDG